jgi:hypothetical protein
VHIAITVLDVLIIGLSLTFARMLRPWFFYVASSIFAVVAVLRLHYGLNYQWAFLGKYGVNVAIPLIMAWAGNYLAAKSSNTDTEKRLLWHALFIALTILALVGNFWVLDNEDHEHKIELSNLRNDIKFDTKVNMQTALVEYNKANPQHQIPAEVIAKLMSFSERQNIAAPDKSHGNILPLADRTEDMCHQILDWTATVGRNAQNFDATVENQWGQRFVGSVKGLYLELAERGLNPDLQTLVINGNPFLATLIGEQLCSMAAQLRQQAPHSNQEARSQLINQAILDRLKRFDTEGRELYDRCSTKSPASSLPQDITDWVNRVAIYVRSSGLNEHFKKEFDTPPQGHFHFTNVAPICAESMDAITTERMRIMDVERSLGK